jgi:tetratricopeptide (TPR) repeat protein
VDRNVWEQAVELHGDLAQGLSVLGDGFRIKLRRIRERLGMERKKSYSATVGSETVKLSVEVFDKDITAFVENVAQETQRYAGKLKSHTAKMPILLVGGGSQMPGLKQALEALKLGPVLVWNHSEFATVLGAVPQPVVKATPTDDKSGRWEEYHKSVKICWADKAIQPGEVEHLAKLKKQLGIGESEAEQIERKVIGKSIVELVTDSRRQAASNAKAKAAMDRTMLRRRISDGNAEAVFKELCQSVVEEPSDDVFEMWREAQIVVPDGNKVLDASRAISRKRGNDLYGSCCLALALHDLGRKEEAQNAIAHLIVPKRDIPLPLLLVQLEDAEGDVKLQQALARKVLDRGRCGAEMWATLAWLAIEQGDASTIETSLDKAYAHNPDDLSLLYAKCLAFLSKGIGNEKSFKHALSALERISHGHWITGYFASQHLIREQDWGGALTRFEKVLSDPRVRGRTKLAAYIRIVRANCFLALDQAPSAMVEVEECLRLDPASVAGLILRGGFRLDAGSPELALHDFELAASLAPDNVDAVMGEANCRLQLGRVEEASAGYLRVWKADPNHRDAMTLATWCCILENSNGGTSLAQLGNDCYLLGRMNSIKLANATRHYISPFSPSPEPQVLLLLDVTSLGGGEDGLALTEDSIWWGTEGRITPGCQKYEDITSVQFNSGSLSINGTAVVQFYQSGRVLVPILEALAALHAKRRAGSRSVRSDLQATTTSALCPKGHGRLRVWDGVPSCWTCGWTETRRGK